MRRVIRHFDTGSLIIIVSTLVLFVVALFLKGLTHDLLLEIGVFLVSLKLILLSYHNSSAAESMRLKLEQIHESVLRLEAELPQATAPPVSSPGGQGRNLSGPPEPGR